MNYIQLQKQHVAIQNELSKSQKESSELRAEYSKILKSLQIENSKKSELESEVKDVIYLFRVFY